MQWPFFIHSVSLLCRTGTKTSKNGTKQRTVDFGYIASEIMRLLLTQLFSQRVDVHDPKLKLQPVVVKRCQKQKGRSHDDN